MDSIWDGIREGTAPVLQRLSGAVGDHRRFGAGQRRSPADQRGAGHPAAARSWGCGVSPGTAWSRRSSTPAWACRRSWSGWASTCCSHAAACSARIISPGCPELFTVPAHDPGPGDHRPADDHRLRHVSGRRSQPGFAPAAARAGRRAGARSPWRSCARRAWGSSSPWSAGWAASSRKSAR